MMLYTSCFCHHATMIESHSEGDDDCKGHNDDKGEKAMVQGMKTRSRNALASLCQNRPYRSIWSSLGSSSLV